MAIRSPTRGPVCLRPVPGLGLATELLPVNLFHPKASSSDGSKGIKRSKRGRKLRDTPEQIVNNLRRADVERASDHALGSVYSQRIEVNAGGTGSDVASDDLSADDVG